MNKNPVINALLAFSYIVGLVFFIGFILQPFEGPEGVESILAPMMMLSLFVLSAATMGYLFLAEPLQLYLDGKKKEGVDFFLRTLMTFAVLVAVLIGIVTVIFSGVR